MDQSYSIHINPFGKKFPVYLTTELRLIDPWYMNPLYYAKALDGDVQVNAS